MSTQNDPRSRVGAHVHTKAHFATNEAEAKRLFGVRWNLKLITGTIASTRTAKSNVGEQCLVTVAWEFPGNVSTSEVYRRNLKAGNSVMPPSEDSGGTFSAHDVVNPVLNSLKRDS
jgi:hypothetical protein